MKFHKATLIQGLTYVDYEDVVAKDGHIKTAVQIVE